MDQARVQCPYCGEEIELLLEEDLEGEMVWDCEVCCRPWRLQVLRRGGGLELVATTDDDS